MASRWYSTVIDARDPRRLAHWWAEVLGFEIVYETAGETAIRGEAHPGLVFVPVTAGKIVKNRLHIDLEPDDQDAEVERLVDMGARHVDVGQRGVPWVVLADPEGNEFCVLSARDR